MTIDGAIKEKSWLMKRDREGRGKEKKKQVIEEGIEREQKE